MKLSKVKKICMNAGEIVVKRAETGIDIQTWIGTSWALYPVRGLTMNAEMAVRIWEIEPKKLREMQVTEDGEEESITLIGREELESLAFMADVFQEEDEKEAPGLVRVATINDKVLLVNRKTGKALIIDEELLTPIEGEHLLFIPVNESGNLIAVYGSGMLEAVIYGITWHRNEFIKFIFHEIAVIYRDDDFT